MLSMVRISIISLEYLLTVQHRFNLQNWKLLLVWLLWHGVAVILNKVYWHIIGTFLQFSTMYENYMLKIQIDSKSLEKYGY